MQAQIHDRFESLNNTDAGRAAIDEYVAAVSSGKTHEQAEIVASNVLQRAGYNVNAAGGASFRVASIDHNEEPDTRVSLVINYDDRGYYVETDDGEDTEARFGSADEAFDSIDQRWGNGWGLELAGA